MPGFGVTRNAASHAIHALPLLLLQKIYKFKFCFLGFWTVGNIVWVCRRKLWGNQAIKSLFFEAGAVNNQPPGNS